MHIVLRPTMIVRIVVLAVVSTLFVRPAASCSDPTVPDSPSGFNSQYQPLFSAWARRDNLKLKTLSNEFAIPNRWFIDTFGPDEGPELAKTYSDQFEDFETHLSRSFAMAAAFGKKYADAKRYRAGDVQMFLDTKLSATAEPKPAPKPPPASLQPLPPIQRFSTQARLRAGNEDHDILSWMDSFVYINGSFRFLGRGAYPFWDAAKVRLADPCAKPGEQTGGKLLKRVEPEYPEAARNLHIEGTVSARLTIATDGTVKEVEITNGPPALLDAARQAFQQWLYTPFMNCGKPVEMRSIEHVKFSIP